MQNEEGLSNRAVVCGLRASQGNLGCRNGSRAAILHLRRQQRNCLCSAPAAELLRGRCDGRGADPRGTDPWSSLWNPPKPSLNHYARADVPYRERSAPAPRSACWPSTAALRTRQPNDLRPACWRGRGTATDDAALTAGELLVIGEHPRHVVLGLPIG